MSNCETSRTWRRIRKGSGREAAAIGTLGGVGGGRTGRIAPQEQVGGQHLAPLVQVRATLPYPPSPRTLYDLS